MPVPSRPGVPESQEPASAAFGARPMTCRQSRGFVEKEEFGVGVGSHHHPMPSLEFEHREEPTFYMPRSADVAVDIVEDAPVAHHRPPLRYGDDLAKRA
jgi:hypothetical protein